MALQDVKTAFAEVPLSEEVRIVVNSIIDASLARGGMTGEEREKLFAILNVEDELGDIERSAAEEAIRIFQEYQDEVDSMLEKGATDLEALERGIVSG